MRALRATTLFVLLFALAATAAATWGTYAVVHDQETRLLKERVSELNLLLTNSVQAIPTALAEQGAILKATGGSRRAFEEAAASAIAAVPPDQAKPTFAWLKPEPGTGNFTVLSAVGDALHLGGVVAGPQTTAFTKALQTPGALGYGPFDSDRKLAFVLGPPAAPAGTVLLRQAAIGPVQAPRAAATAPYAELDVAIYAAPRQDLDHILATTTKHIPLRDGVRTEPLAVDNIHWLVAAKAKRPLVGTLAANAWWIALLIGLLGSALLAAVVETSRRRRDAALALYASEHQVAETLQRSLLPRLPRLAGLDIAARYLAGSKGQEVGGDWFDVFPVSNDGVAITVGDVVGHDLTAASAMAQIRAAVRAYGVDGDQPHSVISRLDGLVQALQLTPLATVVYGVLSPPESDGSRVLRYTNAGHPAPLVRRPNGQVEMLDAGASVLIGAATTVEHTQAEHRLESGSTLLMFTDGLVEEPGRSLEEATDELVRCFADFGGEIDLDGVCDQVLTVTAGRELRDDVALLVIRIGVGVPAVPAAVSGSTYDEE